MLTQRNRLGIIAILLLACFMIQLAPSVANAAMTDWQMIGVAKKALTAKGTLYPQENVDTDIVPMVQAIVDKAAPGVKVTFYESRHPQISSSGAIIYGTKTVTNNVVVMLTKNKASNKQLMRVVVPAKAAAANPDAVEVAAAKAALANTASLKAVEGKDTNAATMAQSIVNAASSGVTVQVISSSNPQVAVDGAITYGNTAVTGNVTLKLTKNNASDTQAIALIVPAKIVTPTTNVVNVKDYGAKGDGVSDDAAAIQNAANAARSNKYTLYIPSGDYYLGKSIYIYTSVNCEGRFVIKNSTSTPSITIARSVTGVNIPASSLSGLTRGSSKITGLNGYAGGTVVLKSSEVLIRRWQGSTESPAYTKNDASVITSTYGSISPALDCTYSDTSQLTVTVYPKEDPITITGLSVRLIGDTKNYSYSVWVKRSNVTFKNITLNNTSAVGSPEGGMYLVDCTNVTINNPVISGYVGSGDKYGICMGITANLTVDGGKITDARHGITGRHSKNVIIRNGTYTGTVSGVDNHWGNNFLVENCIIDGNSGVSYAGTDITVRNCQLLNCINIFTLRNDTPEIIGEVVVENVTAKSPSNYSTMYCYRATYEGLVRDYGHKLAVPQITISGVRADISSKGYLYYKQILAACAADYVGKMTFTDIQTVNGGTIRTQ
ncbi:MAG: glycosyl hydrolase family 28-related protein [Syntrophomonadaceae bacterium]|jgi:hypothetical protein